MNEIDGTKKNVEGIFKNIFNDDVKLKELYYGLTGVKPSYDAKIQILRDECNLSIDARNLFVFTIDKQMIFLLEQRATLDPIIILSMIVHVSEEFEKIYNSKCYSENPITLPLPKLYVIYKGTPNDPDNIRLSSDSLYENKGSYLNFGMTAYNINYEKQGLLLQRCQAIKPYSQFNTLYFKLRSPGISDKELKRKIIENFDDETAAHNLLAEIGDENYNKLIDNYYKY